VIRVDSYRNWTRKVDIVRLRRLYILWYNSVERDLVQAADIYWQDCGQFFSVRRQSPYCTKSRTVSENWGPRMYGRVLCGAHCLIRPMSCFLLNNPLSTTWFHILHHGVGLIIHTFFAFFCWFWDVTPELFSLKSPLIPNSVDASGNDDVFRMYLEWTGLSGWQEMS